MAAAEKHMGAPRTRTRQLTPAGFIILLTLHSGDDVMRMLARRGYLFVVAIGISVVSLSSPADAACSIARFKFRFGQTFPAQAQLGSGQTCNFAMHAGRGTVFQAIRIVEPPKHGTATPRLTGVGYRAKEGYKGADSFTFAVIGHSPDSDQPARVEVSVTVH